MTQFMAAFAVYFIIWWTVLFIVLPIGLRTQADENEVVLGTVESAPAKFRGARVVLVTSLVSALIYCCWWGASTYLGFSLNSLPRIVPDFGRT